MSALCLNHGWFTNISWSIPDRNCSNGLELKSPNEGCSTCVQLGSSISICELIRLWKTVALPSCERKLARLFWQYCVLVASCCKILNCVPLFELIVAWTLPQLTTLTEEFATRFPRASISSCKLATCTHKVWVTCETLNLSKLLSRIRCSHFSAHLHSHYIYDCWMKTRRLRF